LRRIFPLLLLLLLINSCTETGTKPQFESAEVIFEPDSSDSNRIFIRDRTGKEWDVTHAVNKYEFDPERFQFGAGPFAIKPILQPQFISRGDPGYDSIDENTIVIGTFIKRNARAYPLYILGSHEIVDENFGTTYVAVGY